MIKAVILDMYETLITQYDNPVYFSEQMSEDLGISLDAFRNPWRASDKDRTLGLASFEDVIGLILKKNGKYSRELVNMVSRKRTETKKENFRHIDKEIIPVLEQLKNFGLKIGLVSNCYIEEALIIKDSILYKYFDAVCLSSDEKIMKPDPEIFLRCTSRLNVQTNECLYIGDGGSSELKVSSSLGMNSFQAGWYLVKSGQLSIMRDGAFKLLIRPSEIIATIYK